MGRVDDKVALISGGARGMGAADARMLVREGAKVVIGDILDDDGAKLAEELGDAARYVHLDVTSAEDWKAAVDTTVQAYGTLNVLVNNAGIVQAAPLKTADITRWQKVLDVNLTGAMRGIQAVIDPMIAAGGGSIINVSSIEGMRGAVWAHSYVASKWGLRGLTKSAALELAPEKIVMAPMGRPGTPDEVATFVVFLASDESSFSTGSEYVVDGGLITDVPHRAI